MVEHLILNRVMFTNKSFVLFCLQSHVNVRVSGSGNWFPGFSWSPGWDCSVSGSEFWTSSFYLVKTQWRAVWDGAVAGRLHGMGPDLGSGVLFVLFDGPGRIVSMRSGVGRVRFARSCILWENKSIIVCFAWVLYLGACAWS